MFYFIAALPAARIGQTVSAVWFTVAMRIIIVNG
jgi:hypothetical protein